MFKDETELRKVIDHLVASMIATNVARKKFYGVKNKEDW